MAGFVATAKHDNDNRATADIVHTIARAKVFAHFINQHDIGDQQTAFVMATVSGIRALDTQSGYYTARDCSGIRWGRGFRLFGGDDKGFVAGLAL